MFGHWNPNRAIGLAFGQRTEMKQQLDLQNNLCRTCEKHLEVRHGYWGKNRMVLCQPCKLDEITKNYES